MGNRLTDSNKSLQFSYNLANLPCRVEGMAGSANAGLTLSYGYLADGTKTSAVATRSGNVDGLKYRGSFVYEVTGSGERLCSIAWDEGRISLDYSQNPANPAVRDEWHVRDHLGSTRAVVNLTDYGTVLEQNEYLPFGTRLNSTQSLATNRYRFGGKEEQRFGTGASSLDLCLSDFGARYYDPFTARWTTRDPMAWKYYSLSPYNYCAGNPANLVDTGGSIIDTFIDAASLATGVNSFISNVKQGKVGAAIVDGIGIALDAAAVATPFIPGGVSAGIKAVRGADKAADALKALNKADDVYDTTKGANAVRNIETLRRQAVKDAWKAEAELVKKTGHGTRDWSKSEIRELLETGKVKGYEGHHINNVNNHPELAGNPNNITFVNKSEHLSKHCGNYRKETHGYLLDRTIH